MCFCYYFSCWGVDGAISFPRATRLCIPGVTACVRSFHTWPESFAGSFPKLRGGALPLNQETFLWVPRKLSTVSTGFLLLDGEGAFLLVPVPPWPRGWTSACSPEGGAGLSPFCCRCPWNPRQGFVLVWPPPWTPPGVGSRTATLARPSDVLLSSWRPGPNISEGADGCAGTTTCSGVPQGP